MKHGLPEAPKDEEFWDNTDNTNATYETIAIESFVLFQYSVFDYMYLTVMLHGLGREPQSGPNACSLDIEKSKRLSEIHLVCTSNYQICRIDEN